MDIYIYLIPFTVLFSLIGLFGLIWAIKSNQYEDMKKEAERILLEKEDNSN